ncbi:MAG: hypothetical protein LBS57_09295 [Treponema sp.]|jgi:hypothetical protein|nr:hypothetical protein [Treponema sp.]
MKRFNPKVYENWMKGLISSRDFRRHLLAEGWDPLEAQKVFFSIPKDKLKKQMESVDSGFSGNGLGSAAAHFL